MIYGMYIACNALNTFNCDITPRDIDVPSPSMTIPVMIIMHRAVTLAPEKRT